MSCTCICSDWSSNAISYVCFL